MKTSTSDTFGRAFALVAAWITWTVVAFWVLPNLAHTHANHSHAYVGWIINPIAHFIVEAGNNPLLWLVYYFFPIWFGAIVYGAWRLTSRISTR